MKLIDNLIKLKNKFFIPINPQDYPLAVFIVNYNMPERTDLLVEHLNEFENWPMDIYVIDNGSDIERPSKYTNVYIKKNIQTCRGWLKGLTEAKKTKKNYFAYMFLITSTKFEDAYNQIDLLMKFLIEHKNAVGIHPSLTKDSTTYWTHLLNRNRNKPRKTWMIDNIASIFRSDWFDSIGWFDKRMIYAWGIDLETCYIARKQGRDIYVDDRVQVTKITNIGYKMNRMNMEAEERVKLASDNMEEILSLKYGKDYLKIMLEDYVDESLR